jgi:hypothetical protein
MEVPFFESDGYPFVGRVVWSTALSDREAVPFVLMTLCVPAHTVVERCHTPVAVFAVG